MQKEEKDSNTKKVRVIPKTIEPEKTSSGKYRQKRVVAYCRVSTAQEEQLNSYETQRAAYTDMINQNPDWVLVKIFADKGITGTSVKNRDEFNKMIRLCKQGKVDMIITKSISRFARNTVDCLHYTRLLKKIGVDVYFEEQKIHSTQPGAEFYITIYGSIAQSESENISANVRWGKLQSAKQGKVAFHYKNFLGYKKGEDGKPTIDPEEAEIIKFIYERFLTGDSLGKIAKKLTERQTRTPTGKDVWSAGTVRSILNNEKYKGDTIIYKTFIADFLSKEVKVNRGERPKYYIQNSHPAIIDSYTFDRAQEELARRSGKPKVKQVGTKTESGKYSGKYALTELLVCGECKTPYRRCTWTIKGKKKIVWRCINRLDYGKKYCHNSPSVEEGVLQEAIMDAIRQTANQNFDVQGTLIEHIRTGLDLETDEFNISQLELRIREIDAEFKLMVESASAENIENFDEIHLQKLIEEKSKLQQQLNERAASKERQEKISDRIETITSVLDGLRNHPMSYNDELVRQLIDCIVVESKEKIKIVFRGGLEVEQNLYPERFDLLPIQGPIQANLS